VNRLYLGRIIDLFSVESVSKNNRFVTFSAENVSQRLFFLPMKILFGFSSLNI